MKTKHKILECLYQVHTLDKKHQDVLIEEFLDINLLKTKVNAKEKDFYASLETLNARKEIIVYWDENTAIITQEGIISYNSKKYIKEHINFQKERASLLIQIGTFIVVIISLIISINRCQ